jgi:gamma-glutamyl:cysteine ligase YbdK (ATP-grasp superfamily)
VWGSEENLVQAIGEQAVKQKGKAWNWWNKFIESLRNIFKSADERTKLKLRNTLTNAFLTRAELLEYTSTVSNVEQSTQNSYYSRNKNDIDALVADIKKGVDARLTALKRYSKRNLAAEEEISRLRDALDKADSVQATVKFVEHVEKTVSDAIQFLEKSGTNITPR